MAAPLNILLVDDERLVLELLARTLTDHGHRVTAVSEPPAAIAAAGAETFDIAILDNFLGAARGLDLMRELAAAAPGISCVLMTGDGQPELREEALKAGAVDFLPKPIFEKELLCSVAGVVAARGSSGAQSA